jgi:hypothetical protein
MKNYIFSRKQAPAFKKSISTLLFIFTTSFLLGGCGQDEPTAPLIKKPVKKFSKLTTLKGTVYDDKKTIKAGLIKVTNEKGNVITTTELQNDKHYTVEIPADTTLPIILTFYPKGANKDQLISVGVDPYVKTYDITPRTTAIAEYAKSLGGYTHSNILQAANSGVSAPGRNRTSSTFKGDPTKQFGGWH